MLLILVLLELLGAVLGVAPPQSQLYEQVQVHDSELDLSDTSYDSPLACTMKCLASYPACKVFVWSSPQCRHGIPTFKGDKSGGIVTAYMRTEEKEVMDLLSQMETSDESRRRLMFEDTQWVLKDKLYWKSLNVTDYESAKAECNHFGGILAVLHDKDVLDFFLENNLVFLHEDPELMGFPTAIYIGLVANPDSTDPCKKAECNGKMTWADGEVFEYQPHLDDSLLDRPHIQKGGMIHLNRIGERIHI